ncbi:MAG: hypothetical protein WCI71_11195, partial [Bacteroidota bacterium]
MNKIIPSFPVLLIVCSVTLSCCSYKPTDEFYRDLHPVAPRVTISTLSGSDTVVVSGAYSIDILIDAGQSYHCLIDVFIEGVKKFTATGETGQIGLPANWIVSEPGIYPIHLNVYLNTKSGSIADALGTEAFLFQKDLVLIYDNHGNYYPRLTFEPVAGNLKCILTVPPDGPMIRKIEVRKGFEYQGPFYNLTSVTGTSPFSFYDDSYVGENGCYMVKTYIGNAEGTVLYPFTEWFTEKSKEIRPAVITLDDKGLPVIQWQKNPFPSNCSGYRIFDHIYATNDTFEIATVNDINQTTLTTSDIAFPGSNEIFVSHLPGNPPPGYNQHLATEKYASPAYITAGLSSFSFDRFFAPVGNDFFTTYGPDHIFRYAAQTLTVVDEISTTGTFRSVRVSPNDKFLIASTGISDFDYLLYDITASSVTYIPAHQVIGSGIISGVVSVSDMGVGAVTGGNNVVLYDFVHQQKLNEITFSQEPRAEISPSGSYFFAGADKLYLYSFSGGNITEIWHSTASISG